MANLDDNTCRHQFSHSNLKIDAPRKLVLIEENSLVFLRPSQMSFDIDIEKLSLEALRTSLTRITFLLNKPTVVERLPDQGHQLRLAQEKVRKEIVFREDNKVTHSKVKDTSVKCASESDMVNAHTVRLCSLDRSPQRERYRPNVLKRKNFTGQTKSMKELRTGIQMIGLSESLTLQIQQDARNKLEQLRNKKEKLAAEEEEETAVVDVSELDLEGLEEEEEVSVMEELDNENKLKEAVKKFVLKLNDTENDDKEQVECSGMQRLFSAMELSSSDSDIEPSLDVSPLNLGDT
ncbi:uncharacterized protein [Euwallacea similis]|uniref:uncharacterized protein n=1 Tax=Euwallacea similis TaxID=1736056 RepID=UPI003450FE12